jgi:3-oxoacyl-[acyl-carrier-protein] synthase II
MTELVIRGTALAAPFGRHSDIQAFLASDRSHFAVDHGPGGTPVREGRCAWADEAIVQAANGKLRKQVDRSTLLAMDCLNELAQQRGQAASHDLDDIGLFVASQFGGMDFSEIQLANLVLAGPRKVSAYQAISWFYAATQGQWTIAQGSHGFAKSFAGDLGGFVQTLTAASMALRTERVRAAFCGAVDCCLTPFARRIVSDAYPMEMPLGEGGAFFWLEMFTDAAARASRQTRGVRIVHWGTVQLRTTAAALLEAPAIARRLLPTPCSHLLILQDAARSDELRGFEERVIEELHLCVDAVTTVNPKTRFGHLLCGALPVDVALAAHMLVNGRETDASTVPAQVNGALVLSLSPYGLLNHVFLQRT